MGEKLPPVESIRYLLEVFIEGGWIEDEDIPHIDAINDWLSYLNALDELERKLEHG